MKLIIKISIVLLVLGTVLVILGAFFKIQNFSYYNLLLISGLVFEFAALTIILVTVYRQKKKNR